MPMANHPESGHGGSQTIGRALDVPMVGIGNPRIYDRSHKRRLRTYQQVRRIMGSPTGEHGHDYIYDLLDEAANHETGYVCMTNQQAWWTPTLPNPLEHIDGGFLMIPLID